MKRIVAALIALMLGACATAQPAAAQTVNAKAVSVCGTPGNTPVVGNSYPVTADLTGVLCTNASGGGGGGAVTIADGADITQGSKADAAWTSGAGSTIAILKAIAGNSAGALPAGSNIIGSITPLPVTPAAGTASTITTGGTAVTLVTGPVKGCYITNPASATDQGIGGAENAYVNPVTTATTTGNGTNLTLVPGQSFYCVPGQTTNISGNAATSAHKLTVVAW